MKRIALRHASRIERWELRAAIEAIADRERDDVDLATIVEKERGRKAAGSLP